MEERDKIRYQTLFYCQKLEDGYLSGDSARALFIRSKLPLLDLTRIWKLSDITRDNKLDVFEFSLAMHFIELKLMGVEIPKQNDITITDCKEVVVPKMTLEEKQQIKDIFEYADTNSQGFLEINIVKPILLMSELPPSTLSRIWNIADLDRDGKLCLLEFTIALHLLKNCIKGVNLNGPVNAFAFFPNEDDAICSYKEKLAVFDKEFLLKRIQEDNEDELFQNSADSAHFAGFQLLTDYLFDGQLVSTQVKNESNVADENRNVISQDDQQDEVMQGSRERDLFLEEEKHAENTDTIERLEMNKNALNIDLEHIFETISKENMDESEEAPRFVAKLEISSAPAEDEDGEDEIPAVLPYFQKRTYFGKDLVFEDPIGSELIGDVEFEVDFDYIINDIEKEMVDEERRLPIARVLPIYKTPPVSDEQPFERTITTKGERNLNMIDVNMEGFYKQENRTLNNEEKGGAKEARISSKEIFVNEKSADCRTNVDKNVEDKKFDGDNAPIDDIVEQKRLLLQSQQEERKKLRENHVRNTVENDQNSRLLSSVPISRKAEQNICNENTYTKSQERYRKTQYNLTDSKEGWRNDNQPDFEISNSEENKEKNESKASHIPQENVTTTVKHNDNEGYEKSKSCSENHYEDEEEKKRLREAEDKERILLERIKFLEKKRQQLYEKKQRELLNSNNVTRPHEQRVHKHGNKDDRGSEIHENANVTQWKQNSTSFATPDPWSGQPRTEVDEEEKRRLSEALAVKRKNEAELERQRVEVLRAAEKRRLEEEAKRQEEQEEAKERKKHFLENLKRLKERVLTEEEEKSKVSNSQSKREPDRPVRRAMVAENMGSVGAPSKSHSLPGQAWGDFPGGMVSSNTLQKNESPPPRAGYKIRVEGKQLVKSENGPLPARHDEANSEEQKKEDEMWRENFKSNRELFMKRIQTEAELNTQVQKREKKKNVRPKSFYGGMFNQPVHQVIDDSLLIQNVDSASVGDLVDQEALKQFQREQELKREQEKVYKLRHSLDRDSSYTVENVEQLFSEVEMESKNEAGDGWNNLEKKEARKASSHPHRRSLVNTLTTEWNSFIDVIEEDNRRESETVKIRKEISAQRETSAAQTSKTVSLPVEVVKSDSSKEILEEKEIFAKQAGKVKKLVTTYKRLSVPCFLDQDDAWNVENPADESKLIDRAETHLQAAKSSTSCKQEPGDTRFDQKSIIKENAPRRKSDLAHAWSHKISNQQKSD